MAFSVSLPNLASIASPQQKPNLAINVCFAQTPRTDVNFEKNLKTCLNLLWQTQFEYDFFGGIFSKYKKLHLVIIFVYPLLMLIKRAQIEIVNAPISIAVILTPF